MRAGFTILAHEHLDRVAALARHLAGQGAPVVVHVDARVPAPDRAPLDGLSGVTVLSNRKADWGRFGLVDATLDCVRALLADPRISHVCLLSGSCLPIRPLADLDALLAGQAETDFIESVPLAREQWVQDGLSAERFTLFHPFSHRRSPRLFSASVELQRGLGIRRRLPPGLEPHLGMQWWCLSTRTLRAILDDPRLPAWRRFFRHAWIPDEGFFQTIVRAVRPGTPPRPALHLARFDPRGRPYSFHDDHAGLLAASDRYFARKIDPDAGGLYAHFLDGEPIEAPPPAGDPFGDALRREREEGRGLLNAARYPRRTTQTAVATMAPYLVLVGDDRAALADATAALGDIPDLAVHGDLFGDGPISFAGGQPLTWGNLPAQRGLRDHRPAQFLAMTVRADAALGRRSVFTFTPVGAMPPRRPENAPARLIVAGQFAGDPNARIVLLDDPGPLLDRLRLPLPARRPGRVRPALPLNAWHAATDPAGLHALAAGDWSDPAGWIVPETTGAWPA